LFSKIKKMKNDIIIINKNKNKNMIENLYIPPLYHQLLLVLNMINLK